MHLDLERSRRCFCEGLATGSTGLSNSVVAEEVELARATRGGGEETSSKSSFLPTSLLPFLSFGTETAQGQPPLALAQPCGDDCRIVL